MKEANIRNLKLGLSIKKIREFRGFTEDYIAKKLGITSQNYLDIEKGQADFNDENLDQIANVLEVKSSTIKEMDEKTVFNHNVQSQVNYGDGNILNNEVKIDEIELRRLREDNKNFLLEIEKLRDELAQLRPLISKLVNNTVMGVV